jgi:hypothetical protein
MPNVKPERQPGVVSRRLSILKPAPENEQIYNTYLVDIHALAADMRRNGQLEPLTITRDNVVISGNRRLAALNHNRRMYKNAHQFADCIVADLLWRTTPLDDRLRILRGHNRNRDKTADEKIREEIIDIDPDEAAEELRRYHQESINPTKRSNVKPLKVEGYKKRWGISAAKDEHVRYILRVLEERRKYRPDSDRGVHYALCHAGYDFFRSVCKQIKYTNDLPSYKLTCDLLTRMRLLPEGHKYHVPWEALDDPTRPMMTFEPFDNVREFIRQETDNFLKGYWRNYQQSQPNHVMVYVEKNTIYNMVLQVTRRYQIPTVSARGFNSSDSMYDIAESFRASGKKHLDLITLTDHDTEGLEMRHDVKRRLRDDHKLGHIYSDPDVVRVWPAGLLYEDAVNLPESLDAKTKSTNYEKYKERTNGDTRVWELEAMDPAVMLDDLDRMIRSIIDVKLFNAEVEEEKREAVEIQRVRRKMANLLRELGQL